MKRFEKSIYVTKSFLSPIEEYVEKIKEIWETNWITNNGQLHNELQVELSNYLKVNSMTKICRMQNMFQREY